MTTYRLKNKTDWTEEYDVLDPETGETVGFFVRNLHTGNVTDSSIGAFAPKAKTRRDTIARWILRDLGYNLKADRADADVAEEAAAE